MLLAACGGPPEDVTRGDGNALEIGSGTPAETPVEHIACALGNADYADTCTIDRTATPEGSLLTIRHADGGFRRLRVSRDGVNVVAADGALPAQVIARTEAGVEVAVGDARYRLPLSR